MRKILVTGAGGFVGARILDQWRGRYELCTFPHGFSADSDEAAVRALIAREKPDVIVHTAALSNTAYCASHPEESLRANVLLPEWIAKAAAETGAKLLAFSSDQVYAGCKRSGPLSETLSLAPANVYGCHKLEAEQRVLAITPGAILLRAAWMYDFPGYRLPIRGNLPLNLLRAAKTGTALHGCRKPVRSSSCGRRAPSYSPWARPPHWSMVRPWSCPVVFTILAVETTATCLRLFPASPSFWGWKSRSKKTIGSETLP